MFVRLLPAAGSADDLQRHQLQPDLLRPAEQHARHEPASPSLWCPSDYGIASPTWGWSGSGPVGGTSYSAVTGPWEWDEFFLVPGTFDQLIPGEAQRIAQLGLIYPLSSVRLAAVTDGLSNTLLFGETDYTTWYGAWTVGDGYDTLVGTMAPPNANTPVLPGWQPMSMIASIPAGSTAPSATARSSSSRTRSTPGRTTRICNGAPAWAGRRSSPSLMAPTRSRCRSPTSSPAPRSASGRRCQPAAAAR